MIEPNFNVFLWILLISQIVRNISRIIAGLSGMEVSSRYTIKDTMIGIIWLILLLGVMLC